VCEKDNVNDAILKPTYKIILPLTLQGIVMWRSCYLHNCPMDGPTSTWQSLLPLSYRIFPSVSARTFEIFFCWFWFKRL
jgi:hypothetical protein